MTDYGEGILSHSNINIEKRVFVFFIFFYFFYFYASHLIRVVKFSFYQRNLLWTKDGIFTLILPLCNLNYWWFWYPNHLPFEQICFPFRIMYSINIKWQAKDISQYLIMKDLITKYEKYSKILYSFKPNIIWGFFFFFFVFYVLLQYSSHLKKTNKQTNLIKYTRLF